MDNYQACQREIRKLRGHLELATHRINSYEFTSFAERRLQAVVRHDTDAISLTGLDGTVIYVNACAEQLLGRSSAELVGHDASAWIDPRDLMLLVAMTARLLSGPSQRLELEVRVHLADGSVRWVEASATNHMNEPSIGAVVTRFRDVTGRRIATEALQASERRYRELIEGLPEPVLVHVDRRITYVNEACVEALGVTSAAALVGHSILEFATPATRSLIEARMRSIPAANHLEVVDQSFIRRSDGREIHTEVKSIPFVFEGRSATLSIARDIGRRVEAEGKATAAFTALALAQHRLRAQFHAVPVPIYVWQRIERDDTHPFVLTDFNAAAMTISGGKIAGHLGETADAFFSEDPLVLEELVRCLVTGETIQREMDRASRSSGETRRLFVTYAASAPDLVIVHTEDVTERRKLEAQLRQAQKMEAVGRLAAGVAHDFNNILSVILGYTQIHLEEVNPQDPLHTDLHEIHEAGVRAVCLTRQLLAFSRKQLLEPRVLDLNETLGGLKPMLRRLLGEDIDLSLRIDSKLRGVSADPGQLDQVLMNLVVNARDAMPTGGKLTIETGNIDLDASFVTDHFNAAPGPYVMLAVTDTGIGMNEATRAQIFEPFFTTKGPTQGTGLGLSTVFGIVHQSGGTIEVTSAPGQGTTFKVYLPCAKDAVDIPIPMTLTAPGGGTETILLVEDDEAVRGLVRTLLCRGGYTVLDAQNGGEAFLLAEQFPGAIQLLLTDVVMPRMSGRQVAERLVIARKDMKVLYMSGYTDDAVVHHGIREAGVAFLQKPIIAEVLLRKVRSVLDGNVHGQRRLGLMRS